MNRIHHVFGAALFAAGCIATGSAIAADNSGTTSMQNDSSTSSSQKMQNDKTKVVPSREQVQKNAMKPNNAVLDDNVQREHDRDQGSSNGRSAKAGSGNDSSSTVASNNGKTWDWNQIDTNHDNLVSPDEMQGYLDQHRAGGSSGATDKSGGESTPSTRAAPSSKQ